MPKTKPLPVSKLRAQLPPSRIPFEDSTRIPVTSKTKPPQPRALQALEMGLTVDDPGFNVFVAGEANLGRTYLAMDFLLPRAAKMAVPDDLLYVHNFTDQDKPRLLRLSAGGGKHLKKEQAKAVAALRKEIPDALEKDAFVKKRDALVRSFQDKRENLLRDMERTATSEGFDMDLDEQGGMTLYPLVEGKVVSEDDYERLDPETRKHLKKRGDEILSKLSTSLRSISKEEADFGDRQRKLERALMREALERHLRPLRKRYAANKDVADYLKAVWDDILDNLDQFLPQEAPPMALGPLGALEHSGEDFFTRYEINRFVDNCCTKGAPIVFEDHPTTANLLGIIERETEMGAMYTDFTLIKSGALHRANGGFLVLRIEDISQNPEAWEGLLRALRSGKSRIEDHSGSDEHNRAKTIQPEPVPLEVRVILVGTDHAYEALLDLDDRFPKLFKLKAHMQDAVPRNASTIRHYLHSLARIIDEAHLPPFNREALAAMVDQASRAAEDQKKLSLQLPMAREIMIEASALARKARRKRVELADIASAVGNRKFRANLYEEEFLSDYDRELIKVSTTGTAVGRVNGLSVTMYGDHEFGLPHQIAATVGVGHGGIIDLERESELGGPIHTKAMMILKSYLLGLFAQDKPLVLTGSLCFEQSYAGIEGDSASGAELAALLSALSDEPVDLSLAMTGAVSQSGQILAVGGVTPKIEGFFKVCKQRGLTGTQGVLIPKDNITHLMLSDEVVDAVKDGRFRILPVGTIEQALELLTGTAAGKRTRSGKFSPGTLYARVDAKLAELAKLAARYKG